MTRRRLILLAKAGLSIGFLIFLFNSVSWANLMAALVKAQMPWFVCAIIAGFCQLLISAWRWHVILKFLGADPPPMRRLLYYYFVSGFFNNLAPANLAGDAVRISGLFNQGQGGFIAASSVILERILGLTGLLLLCAWALLANILPISFQLNNFIVGSLIIVAALLAIASIFVWRYPPKIVRRYIPQVGGIIKLAVKKPHVIIYLMLITMFLHIITMLITFSDVQSLSIYISFWIHLAIYAIAGLVISFPISIQGLGVREGIYVGLLGMSGAAKEGILAALALNYVILLIFSVIGGVVFWMSPKKTQLQEN